MTFVEYINPFPLCLIPLRPKYPPQHPLQQHQSVLPSLSQTKTK
jgi:hypothetical protein